MSTTTTTNSNSIASTSSTSSSSSTTFTKPVIKTKLPSFFPTYALDQAFCGVGAGTISTICMHPLDLIKVQQQVSTGTSSSLNAIDLKGKGKITLTPSPTTTSNSNLEGIKGLYKSLKIISKTSGLPGLYRGLTPNLVGNASSWGLYFLWYTMFKNGMQVGENGKLSPGQHLLASAESGVITAVMTNPLWVVKTRMFTTTSSSPSAYKNVWDGLNQLARQEGIRGLSKGMVLALFGVSNGALQFMTYEELKRWRTESKMENRGISEAEAKNLSNTEYILMSGSAKLVSIGITYPYQVIRSRIQYQSPTVPPYSSIPNCITRTYRSEGLLGFYKGLSTNAVRILPGTCVTFVVYENLARWIAKRVEAKANLVDSR